MVQKSSTYDPDSYGQPKFAILPEGPNEFVITYAFEKAGKYGPQWQIEVQPVEEKYRRDDGKPIKFWIPEEGCVNALADAMGKDPAAMPDQDYQPEMFHDRMITAVVEHEPRKQGKGLWANIKRLYPKFTMAQREAENHSNPLDDDFPV
jgi:hypothetical protein